MNVAEAARSRVRQTYRATAFVAATGAMLPMFLSHQRAVTEEQRDLVRDLWVRRWASALLRLFSIDVVIRGNVLPPTRKGDRGRLIVLNHRSAIDVGVILATFGGRMVSRADLANWPLVGKAARSTGTVFVDRASANSGAATIRSIQGLLEDGQTVTIFPEGTTFAGDEVRPFHRGAFIAAAHAEASVLPVGLAYPAASGAAFLNESFVNHLGRMARSAKTRMGLAVGAPIIAKKGVRAAELCSRAHAEVTRLVGEARAIAGP
jgi:1-acyl-sn-glycerol-3-phosphate acyltransferase